MTRVAAIDCGTNTIRLLIAEADRDQSGSSRLKALRRRNEIVRLGQGGGLLGWGGMERAGRVGARSCLTTPTPTLRGRRGRQARP